MATSAADVHRGPDDALTHWNIDGHLLWMAEEMKMVSVRDRRTQQAEELPVLALVLSDATGPIGVELWRDAAADNFAVLKTTYEAAEWPWGPLVRLANVIAKNVKVRSLVPMKKLHSTSATTVRVLAGGEVPTVVGGLVSLPNPRPLVITDFLQISGPTPFLCSVRGVVASCGEVQESRNGREMCTFQVVDAKGHYVTCVAFGENANSEEIALGNDIVLYFAQGMKGRTEVENGKLWLYDEAVLKVERTGMMTPRMRLEIKIHE